MSLPTRLPPLSTPSSPSENNTMKTNKIVPLNEGNHQTVTQTTAKEQQYEQPTLSSNTSSGIENGNESLNLNGENKAETLSEGSLRANPSTVESFVVVESETKASPYFGALLERFSDSERTISDTIAYKIENAISANDSFKFYVLLLISFGFCILFSILWEIVSRNDKTHNYDSLGDFFMVVQVLMSSGYDDSITDQKQRLVFTCILLVGVTLVAILIGLITDSVNAYMERMSDGSTKVVESGHTLLLGWNEASIRAACQIAFQRKVFQVQNETWQRRLFPWSRVLPSTPIACSPIVILTDRDKVELECEIKSAFEERNITERYTKVGRDVIVRQGDPTKAHDLVRVAAHQATSILIMMTAVDEEEQEGSDGTTDNSATIRTVLALRNVMYSNGTVEHTFPKNLRVTVQLSKPCTYLNECAFLTPTGDNVVYPQDIARTVNSLLFFCAAKPGLSRVIMGVLDFQTPSIRCRSAATLCGGPEGKVGWCVGRSMKDVLLNNCWCNATCIGCDDGSISVFDGDGDNDMCYNSKNAPGVMGDPDRIIESTDQIMFISQTSTPVVDLLNPLPNFKEQAKLIQSASEVYTTTRMENDHEDDAFPLKNILLCGWRNVWDNDVNRIKSLIGNVYNGLRKGSSLTFATVKKKEDLINLFLECELGFEYNEETNTFTINEPEFEGLNIYHFVCDPSICKDMEAVFKASLKNNINIDCCIVLGTVAGLEMTPAACDSRVLSILLILRRMSKMLSLSGKTLHVVAENQQDQTSNLAVVPSIGKNGFEPDFVNTQAIVARTLTFNLAFPQIQDAISELIINHRMDSPNFEIMDAEKLGLVGVTTNLGALRHHLVEKFNHRAICVGWFEKNEMIMAPDITKMVTFTDHYRIILIIRQIGDNLTAFDPNAKMLASPKHSPLKIVN